MSVNNALMNLRAGLESVRSAGVGIRRLRRCLNEIRNPKYEILNNIQIQNLLSSRMWRLLRRDEYQPKSQSWIGCWAGDWLAVR